MPWRRATEAMVEAELRQRVALAEEQLADLKTAIDDMRAQRDAWQAMAQARIRPAHLGKARGHGFGQPDDKVKPEVPSEGMDAMQLELSNFQPLAANEAIEEEVPDLGGAEQLSEPMIEAR